MRKPGPATSTRSTAVAEPLAHPLPEALGDLPRRRLQRGREQHRRVGRVVAEAGLLGPLEARLARAAARRRCAGRRRRPRRPPGGRRAGVTLNDGTARPRGSCARGRAARAARPGRAGAGSVSGPKESVWSAPASSVPNAPPITKHTSRPAWRRSSSQPANASERVRAPARVEQADVRALRDAARQRRVVGHLDHVDARVARAAASRSASRSSAYGGRARPTATTK